jgi:hypothetical protein
VQGEQHVGLTGGARGTERVGRAREGSSCRQVSPTRQRERESGVGADRRDPPVRRSGRARGRLGRAGLNWAKIGFSFFLNFEISFSFYFLYGIQFKFNHNSNSNNSNMCIKQKE